MKKKYRIGIDAGGTKVAYGLFDEENNLVDRYQHPTCITATGPEFSDTLIQHIEKIVEKNEIHLSELQGVGICMPSFILFDKGYVCMTSAMVEIKDFAMKDYFKERLPVPVVLDNDSNVAALAEHRYGAGRGTNHMVYMATSTGIGSGLIFNGQLFRGSYGWAGESGHMIITHNEGHMCGCENQGCFMSKSAGRYMPHRIREGAKRKKTIMNLDSALDCRVLEEACLKGDELALELLDESAKYIGICAFNVYQLLNINVFVFGGGMVNMGPLLFDRVRAEFDRLNHIPQPVEFRFAELKQDFGIIGAAELVKDL